MKIRLLGAVCTALLLAVPASAQSSFLMVIGDFPAPRAAAVSAAADPATLVEVAAERACARPYLRNLKAQVMYRECLTEARAQAIAQIEQRSATAQLAAR